MEFDFFLSKLSKINYLLTAENYSGQNFQNKMTPNERLEFDMSLINNPRKAAVLALCYPRNNKTFILLTLRADYKGTHAAQISFPGGKIDKTDVNLKQTALRETQEEVGINLTDIELIAPLSKVYIPPSNFWVSPFLGISKQSPLFKKNYEVAQLIEVDLDDLLNNEFISIVKTKTSYAGNIDVPCFILNKHVVWGATAMILSELKEIFNLSLK